eukprot:15215530-Alexandrium_andersonii.AAC.1
MCIRDSYLSAMALPGLLELARCWAPRGAVVGPARSLRKEPPGGGGTRADRGDHGSSRASGASSLWR